MIQPKRTNWRKVAAQQAKRIAALEALTTGIEQKNAALQDAIAHLTRLDFREHERGGFIDLLKEMVRAVIREDAK